MQASGLARPCLAGLQDAGLVNLNALRSIPSAARARAGPSCHKRSTHTSEKTLHSSSCSTSQRPAASASRAAANVSLRTRLSKTGNRRYATATAHSTQLANVDTPADAQVQVYTPASDVTRSLSRQDDTHDLASLASALHHLFSTTLHNHAGLPREVAWPDSDGGAEEEHQWVSRLEWASSSSALTARLPGRKTVVAVLGSSSEDLAKFSQALLTDPLSSDRTLAALLAARTQSCRQIRRKEQVRTIRYGKSLSKTEDAAPAEPGTSEMSDLLLSSPYLSDNDLEIKEVLLDENSPSMSPNLWTGLLTSDAIIVLSDPLRSSDLYRLLQKPNVVFLESQDQEAPLPKAGNTRMFAPANAWDQPAASSARSSMFVDLDKALQANKILETSAPRMSEFSALSLHSGIPQLSEHLCNLASSKTTREASIHHLLHRAILDFASNLASSHRSLYEAEGALGRLALRTAREIKHSEIELGFTDLDKLDLASLVSDTASHSSSPSTTLKPGALAGTVDALGPKADSAGPASTEEEIVLLQDGSRGTESALNSKRLKWWKLPLGRADDVATDLNNGLNYYFADLEKRLIFKTGRLAERSLEVSLLVDNALKTAPFAKKTSNSAVSYYSAKMHNEIASYSPSTQFGFPTPAHPSAFNLSQTSLSSPIVTRRVQLKASGGAIERLQLRAQQAVVRFYSISGLSIASAVFLNQTSWLQLQQDLPFCVGFAGLGMAAAAWHLQGTWTKAKSKFWKDWGRAQDSMAFDLQTNARETLRSKVFIKAEVALRLLRSDVSNHRAHLKELEYTLSHVQALLSESKTPV